MRIGTKTILATVGAAALIVGGTDAMTYAGTGDSLILGKVNKSKKTTHVISTGNGPALSLQAKGNRPALKVDSKAKVVKLNADLVDGKDAGSLQNNVRVYTSPQVSSTNGHMTFQLPNFPKGRYLATYSVYMNDSAGSTSNPTVGRCQFRAATPGTNVWTGDTSSTSVGTPIGLSATDVLEKGSAAWALWCWAYRPDDVSPVNWYIFEGQPARVTLTKIDKTIGGKLTAARKAS